MKDSSRIGGRTVKTGRELAGGNQPARAGDMESLRAPRLFILASRQETRSSGASYAPLKKIQIVILFRYPTSLVVAIAGGSTYDDLDRIRYDALSIGEVILRPAKSPAQAPGKLNLKYADPSSWIA
jgi:hypothetical protein